MAHDSAPDRSGDPPAANESDFFAPRPTLSRGFEAYKSPAISRTTAQAPLAPPFNAPPSSQAPQNTGPQNTGPQNQASQNTGPKKRRWPWLTAWRKSASQPSAAPTPMPGAAPAHPSHSPQPTSSQAKSRWPFSTTQGTVSAPNATPSNPQQPYQHGLSHGAAPPGITNHSQLPEQGSASRDFVNNDVVNSDFVSPEATPVPQPVAPRLWERQPYSAIAHILAMGGTLTTAWFFGILVAQVFPGSVAHPPLQERFLRKTSRLGDRLWHISELWQSPTSETRIEAIPLPETGPVLAPISLPPVERQPLIDELNTVETELLTLDRRIQTLEKRLGKPPYQGADIQSRLNALRSAIEPSVQSHTAPAPYTPKPKQPADSLLDVAQLKITVPSDALFSPGQSELKDAPLLAQLLDQLVNYPKATILIASHSDDQASSKASRDFTLAQANALGDYLQASLPDQYRWVTLGSGSSQPLNANKDAAQRQKNRRIEILVDSRSQ